MNALDVLLGFLREEKEQTALELWMRVKRLKRMEFKAIKPELSEEDQSIREIMARAEADGLVKHQIRNRTILKEWSIV